MDVGDLVVAPQRYHGKIVRVSGEFRRAFELSTLTLDRFNPSRNGVWVSFWDGFDWEGPVGQRLRRALRAPLDDPGICQEPRVAVTFVGEVQSADGGYGHLGAYSALLVVFIVERAEPLSWWEFSDPVSR